MAHCPGAGGFVKFSFKVLKAMSSLLPIKLDHGCHL